MNNAKCIKSQLPIQLAYCYLAIPIYIFLFGWLKLPLAIIVSLMLTYGLVKAIKNSDFIELTNIINRRTIVLLSIISLLWVYMSGIGGYVFQNLDHSYRNAIFELLIEKDWPIIIESNKVEYAFVYYFAIWLPAACIGKLFGLKAAEFFLLFWCFLGVLITFILISSRYKIDPLLTIFIFIFFSGLDIIENFILYNSPNYLIFSDKHIENTFYQFQYSSHCTQLFWVFNQAIPAWITTILMLNEKNNKSIILLYSLSFLFCTIPSIGLLPILIYVMIQNCKKDNINFSFSNTSISKNILTCLKSIPSLPNLAGLIITLISYLFLSNNMAGGIIRNMFHLNELYLMYLLFILFELMIYCFLIYKHQKNNPLFWCVLMSLIIIPWVIIGNEYDFCMRASIPSLLVLFLLIMETLDHHISNKEKNKIIVLFLILSIGSITVCHEFIRTIRETITRNQKGIPIKAEIVDLQNKIEPNFWCYYNKSLFYKYLAKTKNLK